MWAHLANPAGKIVKNTPEECVFCLIGTENTMPYCQKYTPPVCVFSDFAGWEYTTIIITIELGFKPECENPSVDV